MAAVPLIEIQGDPVQRGHAYGEGARTYIQASIAYYKEAFAVSSGLQWTDALAAARRWRPVVEAVAPHLLAEMDATAEGAGLHPDEVLALNARGEIVRNHDSRFSEASDGCSSFALLPPSTGDQHVYCGQNWDWRVGTQPSVVMLRIVQPPKPTVIMQVEAGQLGRQGANSAGIALNANGLDGRFDTPIGVPQTVLRRLILDSPTLRGALAVPYQVHQHIATNLLVTDRSGVAVDFESTPVVHRWRSIAEGALVHANHYQYGIPEPLLDSYRISSPDSLFRLPVIERGLAAARDAVDSEGVRKVVQTTMSDHSGHPNGVCEHPDETWPALRRSKTIASSLVDLTAGEYRVALGNPCSNPYELLPWDLYDGPGGDR